MVSGVCVRRSARRCWRWVSRCEASRVKAYICVFMCMARGPGSGMGWGTGRGVSVAMCYFFVFFCSWGFLGWIAFCILGSGFKNCGRGGRNAMELVDREVCRALWRA